LGNATLLSIFIKALKHRDDGPTPFLFIAVGLAALLVTLCIVFCVSCKENRNYDPVPADAAPPQEPFDWKDVRLKHV
jgi:hypothetical protein